MPEISRIIHTRRKTIALIIERDGSLVVRAPLRVSKKTILQLVEQKKDWILAKQDQVKSKYQATIPKKFLDGEEFWYLGKIYSLKIVDTRSPALRLDGNFQLSRRALANAPIIFKDWYRQQAARILAERVRRYASEFSFTYKQVKITSARTRWGSCNSKDALSFSWRLVMAPLPVIDYVVVHELVHLQVKNHSREFWRRVEVIMPDYKRKIEWLKNNGYLLSIS